MTAVVYNRARPYTADMWRAIQALVGADVDGVPGEQTATAIGRWQGQNGLAVDGKCGPYTLAAMNLGPLRFHEDGFSWVGDGSICADGSPRAGHPYNVGVDYNANMTSAIVKGADGEPVIQGRGDPEPGYYVVATAMNRPGFDKHDPDRYVDAEAIPYLVLPGNINDLLPADLSERLRKGDTGLIEYQGKQARAIFAEVGNKWTLDPGVQFGEVSIAAAEALGHDPWQLRDKIWRARRGIAAGVTYRVYVGTRDKAAIVNDECGKQRLLFTGAD